MIPTFIGLIQIIVGLVLLFRRSVPGLLAFVMLSGLFGGSAALLLPALGGSSVPPIQLATGFLIMRVLLDIHQFGPTLRQALRSLSPMIVFVGYAALMAVLGPRLFQHQMFVAPMRANLDNLHSTNVQYIIYYTIPLAPTAQNITTSVYMLGGLALAIGAYCAMAVPATRDTLVRCAVAIGLIHTFFGLFGLAVHGTPFDVVLNLLRNGNYSQLDQQVAGLVRINGIFPEPSAYAAYGYTWFVFLTECALRRIKPRATAPVAVLLLFMLVISTSTTAYFGLGVYTTILIVRTLLVPSSMTPAGIIWLAGLVFVAIIIVLGIFVTQPLLADKLTNILASSTSGKTGSISAIQRSFWAFQGLHAFVVSYGLGIGPGSFRSSSFATAVIGSTGFIGTVAFLILLLSVWKPWRPSTYIGRASDPQAVGVAAAWTLIAFIVTSSVAAPSPDPGPDFALLAGCALAVRRSRTVRNVTRSLPPANSLYMSKVESST